MSKSNIPFCPECGNRIRKFEEGENGKIYGKCINDHKIELELSDTKLKFKVDRKKSFNETSMSNYLEEFKEKPNVLVSCPRCGSNECILLHTFTPWGDEESVHILKCLKCKKGFREGYGG